MRKFVFIIIGFFIFAFIVSSTSYAKVLPRFRKAIGRGRGFASGVLISPRIRADRQAIVVNFGNLGSVQSVSYALIYQTDSSQEGASGSIDSSAGNNATRELLFGTCSAGVCRYHTGVKNARLEVTTIYKNGKKSIRRFRIRI